MIGFLDIKITLSSVRFDIKPMYITNCISFIREVHESYLKTAVKLDSNINPVITRLI
jgi:hypothetical protein